MDARSAVDKLQSNQLARDVWAAWRPPPPLKVREWIPRHIKIPDVLETPGDFDLDDFPHVSEVLDAVDDPTVRRILLDWATRNAKTVTCVTILAALVANLGRPGLLGSIDEDRVDDTIQSLVYPLLEACDVTKPLLKPEHRRNRREVCIARAKIRRAFAGSKGSLAGFPAAYGLANEVGLWPLNMVQRFVQRFKLFPFDSKMLFEGKPETLGSCTITALIDAETTDRRYRHVPCPHCGTYQRLRFGRGESDQPGIQWDKPGAGKKSDAVLAQASAWYRCVKGCRITDADRPVMMRKGRWISEGQSIDRRGRITGKRAVESDTVAFCRLSSLYSLRISGWGQIVAEYFDCHGKPELLREFITGTLAEPYNPAPRTVEPHQLVERLGTDAPLRIAPEWSRFLTLAADVGRTGEELIFYWWAVAWGPHARGQVVDYAITVGKPAFLTLCRDLVIQHTDGGEPLRPARIGVDAGSGTNQVYELCEELGPSAWPMKGAAASDFPEWYMLGFKRADIPQRVLRAKQRAGAGDLCVVNTQRSQRWIEDLTGGLITPKDPGWFSLPRECCDDPDFLEQLLGDYPEETYRNGRRVTSWLKRGVNEWRDVARYSRTLAELYTRQGRLWDQLPPRTAQAAKSGKKKSESMQTPDGRPYFVLDR